MIEEKAISSGKETEKMSIRAKWIALMTAVVLMLVGMQLYYGNIGGTSSQSASPETTFDWWIYSGTSSEYYGNYAAQGLGP